MASVTSPSPTTDWYDGYDSLSYGYDSDYYAPPPWRGIVIAPPLPSPLPSPLCINDPWCVTQLVIDVIIFLLGVVGNGLVIWVIGFKMKQKTVPTTWYLSLAVSDFIFCAMLPFSFHLKATGSWIFGLFMCKFTSFVMFLNMFSSIFMMVVISVDRCVIVVFMFWARNNYTLKRAALTVVVAWLFAMVLSIPSLVFRDVVTLNNQTYDNPVTYCYNNYGKLPSSSTGVPVVRFVLGFVFPLVIIIVCSSIVIVSLRLQDNRMARTARTAKPFKVMTAVIVTFVLSWLPYHIFILLDINLTHYTFIVTGLKISVTLLSANSCINPFLYAFMGKLGKQNPRSSLKKILSKIENAFNE